MRGIRPGVDRRDALKGAIALALGLGSFPTVSRAQAKLGTTFDEMVAGARTEGRVVAWITSPHGSKAQQALIDAFNARFGLKTKLEWVPNNPVTSNTRAIVEMAGGGGVSVDIIGAGAIEEVATAANAKLVKPFAWSAVLGAAMPALKDVEDHMIPVFRGDAIPYQLIAYGLCWNPNSINEADLPNKFTDLTDPRFAGKFAFNSFLAPLEITSYVNGPDETIAIAKKLFNNGPVFERGTPAVASAVVTGAVPFGVTNSQVAETSQRNNDPLKFRLFSDVIPLSQVHLYVPENSPNPNTARLFAAWLAAEGSAVGDRFEPMSRVGDPSNDLEKMIAAQKAATGAKIAQATTLEDLDATAKLRVTLNLLLSGQSK